MTIELNHDAADRVIGRGYGVEERRTRPWLIGVAALAVIGAFCGIVWYAYSQGMSQGSRGGTVPVLRADPTPTRERPSEPGGMKVPHQDKLVYDQVGGRAPALAPTVERMLPPPETPIARPVAPPPVAATPPAYAPPAAAAAVPAAPPAAAIKPPAPMATAPMATAPAAVPPRAAVTPVPAPAPASPPVASAPAPTLGSPPANLRAPTQQAAVPAPPPAAAPPAPSGGAYRIQLGAVRGSEAAQTEWEKLKASHGAVLGRLSSQIVRVDLGESRGVFYRIQAGSFGDADAARKTCTALKERNVSCLVVRP